LKFELRQQARKPSEVVFPIALQQNQTAFASGGKAGLQGAPRRRVRRSFVIAL